MHANQLKVQAWIKCRGAGSTPSREIYRSMEMTRQKLENHDGVMRYE